VSTSIGWFHSQETPLEVFLAPVINGASVQAETAVFHQNTVRRVNHLELNLSHGRRSYHMSPAIHQASMKARAAEVEVKVCSFLAMS
jgi:hypothetical protein